MPYLPSIDANGARVREWARAEIEQRLGVPAEWVTIDDALLERVARELSRAPEVESTLRDAWGNWEFPYAEANRRGTLYEPTLDEEIGTLRATARTPAAARAEPAWPDGKRFALCLTHDVDILTQNPTASASARALARDARFLFGRGLDRGASPVALRSVLVSGYRIVTARGMRPRPERTYEAWTDLEARLGFRSSFLFFPEVVHEPHVYDSLYRYDDRLRIGGRSLRVREWMRELADAGFDVGVHGSYHSATVPGLLAEQTHQVETAVGREVVSTRQHWLHYDARVTPGLQAASGLRADSTQGFNRNIGFRAGTAFPYRCWDFERGEPSSVLEIPQHVMDGALFTANALEYDADTALRHCVELMERVEAVGGCLTLNWHPNHIQLPAYWSVYASLLEEAARRGAWGCSMAQLHEWWTERASRIRHAAETVV